MVEEEIFLGLIDQLRVAVPNEIKQAQRVIRERERIIAEAQEEASKILETAKKRVAYLISKEGILNEARQQGEEILRQADDTRKRTLGEIDVFAIEQFDYVEQALRKSLSVMDEAVRHTVSVLDQARDSVGK
jgi:F0F1-type ATP synthase membrane subunit b/b'